jgi:VWFA-related protein
MPDRYPFRPLLVVAAIVCTVGVPARPHARQQAAPPLLASSPARIEVVALDKAGLPVESLTASDFLVTVEGARLPVASIRYVSRGPGAHPNAQRLIAGRPPASGTLAVETSRVVLVVVDQTTIVRGDEKAATSVVRQALDRLGLDDRVGLLRLPLTAGAEVSFGRDRPAQIASLRQVMGQLAVSTPVPADTLEGRPDAEAMVVLNPERAGSPERTAEASQAPPLAEARTPAGAPDDRVRDSNLVELVSLFRSMQSLPGRKTLLLFSAGLTGATRPIVEEAAVAAAQAHVVVIAFGLKSSRFGDDPPDVGALDALARATGGQFVSVSRKAEEAVARVAAGLSSCYVLGLEMPAMAMGRAPKPVRVAVSRAGVTVRAPAWLVPRPDADDAAALPAPVPGPYRVAPEPAERRSATRPASPPSAEVMAREAELQRVAGRVADYLAVYQREFSSVVAEELYEQTDWRQATVQKTIKTRSDMLLVRNEGDGEWVSFRDVFEVEGKPVRERDDRLQRLFLDRSLEGRARFKAILDDSARYNLGPVQRTVNAPQFPLTFLERINQPRMRFKAAGTDSRDGLPVWEIDYVEVAVPTIVSNLEGGDQPATGRFIVEPVSGTVIETRTTYARAGRGQIDYVVKYRRDETLGLWVPESMKETYSYAGRVIASGAARYSRFRRFTVTTDTRVTVPK